MILNSYTKTKREYQTFEVAPFAIVVSAGKKLTIDFANTMALRLLSNSGQEVKGRPLGMVSPDIFTAETVNAIHERCLLKHETFTMRQIQIQDVSAKTPGQSWFDIANTPLFADDGAVVGVVTYFYNAADTASLSRPLELRDDQLAKLFKQAPVGLVCYRGPEFIVDFANDKALEMWGKTLVEVKGKPIHEIFPEIVSDPELQKRHEESHERLKRGQSHLVSEIQLTFMKNGQPRTGWYSYIHEPYTNATGEVIGIMAIAIEVTDQVLARKRLQLITDALPSLVAYINADHNYEFVNKAYENWFGRSAEEYVGKSIPAVIGDEAYAEIGPHVTKVLKGHKESFETWIQYSDSRRYVSASYVPHVDGKVVLGFVSLVNDLTERKRQEDALAESETRLRLLIEGVGAGTFEYDLKAGTVSWSTKLRAILGLPDDFLVDTQTAWSVIHPEDLPILDKHAADLSKNDHDGYKALDCRIVRKDTGEVRWLHTRSKFLFTEEGGKQVPTRLIGFSLDITEQKNIEEKLKALTHNLERKVAERTADLSDLNKLHVQRNEELDKAHAVLQQLIDSSPELIVVVDRNLHFLAVNSRFEEFVQRSRAELLGKEIFEAFDVVKRQNQIQVLQKVLQGERVHLEENPSTLRPDVWFDTHYVPLVLNDVVEGVIILARDISDFVKSQKELANANRQLQDAQHLAKLGSWEWDLNTGTVLWSDEMYRIYGYEEKFAVDFVKATERMSPEDADKSSKRMERHIQGALAQYKETGKLLYPISSTEFAIHLPNGERKRLRSTGKIQLTSEGKLHRLLGTLQDVTQIRSAEAKLGQLVHELEAKNSELESFNYVASHDLKEPLRKIQTFIDRIRINKGVDNDSYLSKIDESAKRMGRLIESVLALSQISNGVLDLVAVDLNKVLDNCKSDLEVRLKERDAKIVSEDLPTIQANETQILQLFSNLISNSLKFCETTPEIRISCMRGLRAPENASLTDASLEYWCLKFKDNGIGFDPKFKKQVFEPFQRLHNKAEYDGTGIGLSIVRKIVERHKGFFDVEAEVGKGAEFLIWLPVNP